MNLPGTSFDYVIAGAGIAGASLAWELARRGAGSILLMEREILAGQHASGRNAALALQNVEDEINGFIARYGARFYSDPPPDLVPAPGFRRTGSLLLHPAGAGPESLEVAIERARRCGLDVRRWTPEETLRRIPILNPERISDGAWCPEDGVVEIYGLLQSLLRSAEDRGVQVLRATSVLAIESDGRRATGVTTTVGRVAARIVINAAGAWAGPLAAPLGLTVPLRPTRRHIVITRSSPEIDPTWPFVWDLARPFYFRPDSGGLLMCPCDVEDSPGCDETVDPRRIAETSALAADLIPSVTSLGVAHVWAGIRTLTPDDRFVIGFDPRLKGYFWMAGFAGHGIVGAPAASKIGADLLLEGRTDLLDAALLAPERFFGN